MGRYAEGESNRIVAQMTGSAGAFWSKPTMRERLAHVVVEDLCKVLTSSCPELFRVIPNDQTSGMDKQRQIFLASLFDISMCRGTASTSPVLGLHQSECSRPSRFR